MDKHIVMFYLFIGLTFAAVVVLIMGISAFLFKHHVGSRLSQVLGAPNAKVESNKEVLGRRWVTVLESLSKLSLPKDGWQDSGIHIKFLQAGIRGNNAPKFYYALKSLLTFGVPLLVGLASWQATQNLGFGKFVLLLLVVATASYYLPEAYLSSRTKKRVLDTQHGLPDLIDLLVICTESGLGLDAALNRVSKEIARTNPYLAEEIYLTNLEIRAGAGRNVALKNLALRIPLDAVHNLVSMLVQADRFGTSVSTSLRIQAVLMRTQRMQAAEEVAAKIPVKMLLPMIFCIFPALIIAIIGPAAIQIRTLLH